MLCSLTTASTVNNYVKPKISNNLDLEINDSRHPVVEKLVPRNEYIVNDIKIGGNGNKINVIESNYNNLKQLLIDARNN